MWIQEYTKQTLKRTNNTTNIKLIYMAHARQNFSPAVERALNQQINNELFAAYTYLALSAHFGNADIALPGAAAYFKNQAYEERQHAEKIIDYINDRGGTVDFGNLAKPTCNCTSLLKAFQSAVILEKNNNKSLLHLHALASENNDPDLTNFLEEFYLREQVIEIQAMTRRANQLHRVGPGLGEHIIDGELLFEIKAKTSGKKNECKSE